MNDNQFPKPPKWLLYLAAGLFLYGLFAAFSGSGAPNSKQTANYSHAKRVDFSAALDTIKKHPESVEKLVFVKGLRQFPDKVVVVNKNSGNEVVADIPGEFDYNIITTEADKQNVEKQSLPMSGKDVPQEYTMGPTGDTAPASGASIMSLFFMVIPIILMGVMIYFMWKSMRGGGAGGMAQKHQQIQLSRLDQLNKKVTFADVAGIEDELEKIKAIAFDILNPEFIQSLGGVVPAGGMLKGKPGTGKTFLVQALAGELGLPVLACSGGDFVDMYVGVGAARVRSMFEQARQLRDKENRWVILFVDEFDAVGKRRGGGPGSGGHDERDQTVGQLLVELQGSESDNSRILVLVATNQPDALDPALIRSGRLGDLVIEISPPDRAGRLAILGVKLKKVPTASDVDQGAIADEMTGLTGADIDTLVTKKAPEFAKMRLLRKVGGNYKPNMFKKDDLVITHEDLWKALEDMIMGTITELKGRRLDPDLKRMIAYHELGHFVLAYRKYLQNTGEWDGQYGDIISAVSILGPSGIGGFVRTSASHDFTTAKSLKSRVAIAMAGNRSERMFLGDVTPGCQNDLEMAMRIVKMMLLQVNMSGCNNKGWKLPAISVEFQGASRYLGGQGSYAPQYGMSDFSARQVDEFISLFLAEAEAEADAYLREEANFIHYMVPHLIKAERMRLPEIKEHWDEFHRHADLSEAIAFPYKWDKNHEGLALVPELELTRPLADAGS